jgi:hypothetical protein
MGQAVNAEMKMMCKNVVVAEFKILYLHLPGRTEENHNKISMPCRRTEICNIDNLKPNQ